MIVLAVSFRVYYLLFYSCKNGFGFPLLLEIHIFRRFGFHLELLDDALVEFQLSLLSATTVATRTTLLCRLLYEEQAHVYASV